MLPAIAVGPEKDLYYHREWFNKVFMANTLVSELSSGVGNLSPRAQLGRFFQPTTPFEYHGRFYKFAIIELPPRVVVVLGWLLMSAFAVAIIWYVVRYRNASTLVSQWGGFALVFSLIPNFSTWTEVHHLVILIPSYLYVVHLWYCRQVTDRRFKVFVVLSVIFLTLTTKTFCGVFLSNVMTSLGFINYGTLFLSAAIFRIARCLQTLKQEKNIGPEASERIQTRVQVGTSVM